MIEVLRTGLYTSIQDEGRLGYQHFGIPIGGAMDLGAMHEANRLLGNPKNSAVLEMSFQGPKLLFHRTTQIAVRGALMEIRLNNQRVESVNVITIKKNDLLQFGAAYHGKRTYLAVPGGFQSEEIFGSQSQYKGLTKFATVKKNELLPIGITTQNHKSIIPTPPSPQTQKKIIQVYKGPEYSFIEKKDRKRVLSDVFTISLQNSRMAYLLEEKLKQHQASLWTGPVLPGTVQYTPSGRLIMLMRDAQTTGGYPRILQITDEGLNRLAQMSTHDQFQFELVEI